MAIAVILEFEEDDVPPRYIAEFINKLELPPGVTINLCLVDPDDASDVARALQVSQRVVVPADS